MLRLITRICTRSEACVGFLVIHMEEVMVIRVSLHLADNVHLSSILSYWPSINKERGRMSSRHGAVRARAVATGTIGKDPMSPSLAHTLDGCKRSRQAR